MIQGCIFDIGGTLIRTEDALLSAIKQTLLENKLTPPPDEKIFIHFGVGHRNIFRKIIPPLCKENADLLIKKCYEQFEARYPHEFLNKFQLLPYAEECLKELNKKGIKTACQTGMERREAVLLLEHFKILKYFPILVAFEDVTKPRPHPEALKLTIKKMGINKTRVLYIGDTITDIQFAKNAGVKIACVITGPQKRRILEKEKPDYLINNLSELVDLINTFEHTSSSAAR
ncbi:MAG: HAD family hydrolase [Candidatus Micrarchaeia archaeon]